jgi:hypothetical protein
MKKSYQYKLPEGIKFEPEFQDDEEVNKRVVKSFVSSLKRPAWYTNKDDSTKDTRETVLNNASDFSSKRDVTKDPFRNLDRFEWMCARCKWATTIGGVDIGHINGWRGELVKAGVLNVKEAKAVYNNLLNLQIECASCNRSHDWEEMSVSVDDEYVEDGFVVFEKTKEISKESLKGVVEKEDTDMSS